MFLKNELLINKQLAISDTRLPVANSEFSITTSSHANLHNCLSSKAVVKRLDSFTE